MKRKKHLIIICGVVAIVAIASSIYANSIVPKKEIAQSFDQMKQNMEQVSEAEILVQGDNFQIPTQRFLFYKGNVEMTYTLQNKPFNQSDSQLINEMIKRELLLQFAHQSGLTVSAQEITDYINQMKELLYDPNTTGDNKEVIKEIMANRIKLTGLSDDEFWESDAIRKEYEKTLLIGKVYELLIGEGEIKNMQDFAAFQNDLLVKAQGTYTIHESKQGS